MTNNISPEFAAALIKATGNIEGAVKDSVNPHFRSKYADLAAVIEAVKKPLNDEGITFVQPFTIWDGVTGVETILIYKTGETFSLGSICIKPEKPGPHAIVAAITYMRRVGLNSLGVPAFDDDGNEASGVKATGFTAKDEGPGLKPSTKAKENFYYFFPKLSAEDRAFLINHDNVHVGHGLFRCPAQLPKSKEEFRITKEAYAKKYKELYAPHEVDELNS